MKYGRAKSCGGRTVKQTWLWHVTEYLEKSSICYVAAGVWDVLSAITLYRAEHAT